VALTERGVRGKHLIAYPNAGLPRLDRETRETIFPLNPDDMAAQLAAVLAQGVQVIGGCCGTGPDHIGAFRRALDGAAGLP
jgi:5-methyltetrahydrofolate--homocysteine methyltransferase